MLLKFSAVKWGCKSIQSMWMLNMTSQSYPRLLKALCRNESMYWLLESLAPKPRRVYGSWEGLVCFGSSSCNTNIYNQCMFLRGKKVFSKLVLPLSSVWHCLGPPTWDRIFDPKSIMNVCLSLSIFSQQNIRSGEMTSKRKWDAGNPQGLSQVFVQFIQLWETTAILRNQPLPTYLQ